jgi:hypothetical protein
LHKGAAEAYGRLRSRIAEAKLKIVRILSAALLALLAAAPALAAVGASKPGGGSEAPSAAWRAQALPVCTAAMRGTDGATPADLDFICGCAVDRFLAHRPDGSPPPVALADIRGLNSGEILACAIERRSELAAPVGRRITEQAIATVEQPPPAVADKPVDSAAPPRDAPTRRDSVDYSTFFDRIGAWLDSAGLPGWAWAILAVFAFLLLRGLFRRADRSDLIGPPPHMRLGARANPPAARRADPPQRS